MYARPRRRHDVRVRARQNLKMLQMTSFQVYNTFQAILSISKISAGADPRARFFARSAYATRKRRFFHMFWVPITIDNNFN